MNSAPTDLMNLLSKLTFRRFWNICRVVWGYQVSRLTQKAVVLGKPVSLSIEPTTSCNLRCPECPSGLRSFTRPTGMMEIDLAKKIVDELSPDMLYLIFYFQGEPFLNKNIFDMIRYASAKKIYTATSTNAHYLTEEHAEKIINSGLDRLIISIDGITQDVYEKYRVGGSVGKVMEGTRNILAARKKLKSKTPHVIFQYLVTRPNEHQIELAKKLAKETGVDELVFKTAQLYEYQSGNELMPENEKYSRYKKLKNGTFALKNKLENHCWRLWHSSVVTWDGKVVPCCFDKDAAHPMGNLSGNSFTTIWKSEPYFNFRNAVLKSRKEIDICTNCSEGTRVFS